MVRFTQFDDRLQTIWDGAVAKEQAALPFQRYAWHKTWYEYFGQGEKLCILADPATKTILPLSILGTTAHFTGGEEIADYLDALGDVKISHWERALTDLRNAGATELLLRNVPEVSATHAFFASVDAAEISEEDTTPILTLPDTFDAYLQSLGRKERHEIKRKIRRFEEAHPSSGFAVRTDPDISLLISLMKRNDEKHVFLTPPMEKFFTSLPTTVPDMIRQATLTVDGDSVATTLMFYAGGSLLLYNSGYTPEIEGSGWYLKAKLIEWAIGQSLTSVNFLQGGERYKYDFGATDAPVYRIRLTL